jgi:hypothetical protein
MTTTELRITRTPLPPVEIPTDETMWGRHDTYAEVTSGSLVAEVLRFAYWDARDSHPLEVSYEVRINGGMPEDGGGMCELYATQAAPLHDLAAVWGCGDASGRGHARRTAARYRHDERIPKP